MKFTPRSATYALNINISNINIWAFSEHLIGRERERERWTDVEGTEQGSGRG